MASLATEPPHGSREALVRWRVTYGAGRLAILTEQQYGASAPFTASWRLRFVEVRRSLSVASGLHARFLWACQWKVEAIGLLMGLVLIRNGIANHCRLHVQSVCSCGRTALALLLAMVLSTMTHKSSRSAIAASPSQSKPVNRASVSRSNRSTTCSRCRAK